MSEQDLNILLENFAQPQAQPDTNANMMQRKNIPELEQRTVRKLRELAKKHGDDYDGNRGEWRKEHIITFLGIYIGSYQLAPIIETEDKTLYRDIEEFVLKEIEASYD